MDLTVKPGDAITADKWNALVERVETSEAVARESRRRIAAFYLSSSWTDAEGGWYKATGRRILSVSSTGARVVDANAVEVYSIGKGSSIVYAIWNGRWEAINGDVAEEQRWSAGDGVAITQLHGGTIDNKRALGVRLTPAEGASSVRGRIALSNQFVINNGVASLRTRRVNAVTGWTIDYATGEVATTTQAMLVPD